MAINMTMLATDESDSMGVTIGSDESDSTGIKITMGIWITLAFGGIFLCLGLINFVIYLLLGSANEAKGGESKAEQNLAAELEENAQNDQAQSAAQKPVAEIDEYATPNATVITIVPSTSHQIDRDTATNESEKPPPDSIENMKDQAV